MWISKWNAQCDRSCALGKQFLKWKLCFLKHSLNKRIMFWKQDIRNNIKNYLKYKLFCPPLSEVKLVVAFLL